jgi:hypothetical protein
MLGRMIRLLVVAALLLSGGIAHAQEKPEVGKNWMWPSLKDWLEGSPSGSDAAGKVVVHWFCKPKSEDCKTDLARIFNMREQGSNVYVIAYINGTKRDAVKLDPVRGEVGAGAVAFGKPVATLIKKLGISGAAMPMSVVVGTDGKVEIITYTGDPDQLDMRDKKVSSLIDGIKIITVTAAGPPGAPKKGVPFELSLSAELAGWLEYDGATPAELKLTLAPDVTCDKPALKTEARRLTATMSCKGNVKGSYEATGALRIRYRGPNRAVGLGEDLVRWKFVVVP